MFAPSDRLHPDVHELVEDLCSTLTDALEGLEDRQLAAFQRESERLQAEFNEAVAREMD